MPSLANLPVEIWERIIRDAAGPANPISNSDFPWIYSFRSESRLRAARKQRLRKLQLLSAVARSWRELCIILSYETFLLGEGNPTPLRWLLNTQLPRFPSLFHRTRGLIVDFPCPGVTISESIAPFVELVGEMPVLQDLALHISPFQPRRRTENRLMERGVIEALRLIRSRLLFLQIQDAMGRDLSHECILTDRSVEILSALAPNLTRLICAVKVDKPSLSDPAPNFPKLQVLHLQLHTDRSEQASVHKWFHRWRLGALKQFGVGYGVGIPIWEWVSMLLTSHNGQNLEVLDVGTALTLALDIPPALWTQCPKLHTIIGSGLEWFRLSVPPTHRTLKALVYKGNATVLFQGNSSQKHFLRELRDIDFAASTTIAFSELTWEGVLGPRVSHNITCLARNVVNAGINAGLRLVDENGEAVGDFFARTGVDPGVL